MWYNALSVTCIARCCVLYAVIMKGIGWRFKVFCMHGCIHKIRFYPDQYVNKIYLTDMLWHKAWFFLRYFSRCPAKLVTAVITLWNRYDALINMSSYCLPCTGSHVSTGVAMPSKWQQSNEREEKQRWQPFDVAVTLAGFVRIKSWRLQKRKAFHATEFDEERAKLFVYSENLRKYL